MMHLQTPVEAAVPSPIYPAPLADLAASTSATAQIAFLALILEQTHAVDASNCRRLPDPIAEHAVSTNAWEPTNYIASTQAETTAEDVQDSLPLQELHAETAVDGSVSE